MVVLIFVIGVSFFVIGISFFVIDVPVFARLHVNSYRTCFNFRPRRLNN